VNGDARDEETLVVAHHHPGRLRVRSRRFEADAALRERIERWIGEQPSVLEARSDAATGSILMVYDPAGADAGGLLVALAEHARLVIDEAPSRAGRILEAARALDEHVVTSSGGHFGLDVAVPLAFGLGSIGSFVWSAHLRAPRWDNLFYWGVQLWRLIHEGHAHRRRHANGT
jgi:hypothetical protein